jgi:hypothetical protein
VLKKTSFIRYLNRELDEARARGVKRPVALLLGHLSAPARAVYRGLGGGEMELPPGLPADEEFALLEVVPADQAAALLREHAGPGGAAAADHVEDDVLDPEWLAVALRRDHIAVAAYRRGRPLSRVTLDYDRASRAQQSAGQLLMDEGPSMAVLCDDAGGGCPVFGKTGFDVLAAGALVAVVAAHPGHTELPYSTSGARLRVRVTEKVVGDLLWHAYRDAPHQVAEAVRALRRSDPANGAWLERLLRNSPGLQTLHRAVCAELTGEKA